MCPPKLAANVCPTLRRRQTQAAAAGGDEMESVKTYFNGTGFERWNKIYGETDDVNKVGWVSEYGFISIVPWMETRCGWKCRCGRRGRLCTLETEDDHQDSAH